MTSSRRINLPRLIVIVIGSILLSYNQHKCEAKVKPQAVMKFSPNLHVLSCKVVKNPSKPADSPHFLYLYCPSKNDPKTSVQCRTNCETKSVGVLTAATSKCSNMSAGDQLRFEHTLDLTDPEIARGGDYFCSYEGVDSQKIFYGIFSRNNTGSTTVVNGAKSAKQNNLVVRERSKRSTSYTSQKPAPTPAISSGKPVIPPNRISLPANVDKRKIQTDRRNSIKKNNFQSPSSSSLSPSSNACKNLEQNPKSNTLQSSDSLLRLEHLSGIKYVAGTFYRRPSLLISMFCLLSLSVLTNLFFCLRCILLRLYLNSMKNASSRNGRRHCYECCLCIGQRGDAALTDRYSNYSSQRNDADGTIHEKMNGNVGTNSLNRSFRRPSGNPDYAIVRNHTGNKLTNRQHNKNMDSNYAHKMNGNTDEEDSSFYHHHQHHHHQQQHHQHHTAQSEAMLLHSNEENTFYSMAGGLNCGGGNAVYNGTQTTPYYASPPANSAQQQPATDFYDGAAAEGVGGAGNTEYVHVTVDPSQYTGGGGSATAFLDHRSISYPHKHHCSNATNFALSLNQIAPVGAGGGVSGGGSGGVAVMAATGGAGNNAGDTGTEIGVEHEMPTTTQRKKMFRHATLPTGMSIGAAAAVAATAGGTGRGGGGAAYPPVFIRQQPGNALASSKSASINRQSQITLYDDVAMSEMQQSQLDVMNAVHQQQQQHPQHQQQQNKDLQIRMANQQHNAQFMLQQNSGAQSQLPMYISFQNLNRLVPLQTNGSATALPTVAGITQNFGSGSFKTLNRQSQQQLQQHQQQHQQQMQHHTYALNQAQQPSKTPAQRHIIYQNSQRSASAMPTPSIVDFYAVQTPPIQQQNTLPSDSNAWIPLGVNDLEGASASNLMLVQLPSNATSPDSETVPTNNSSNRLQPIKQQKSALNELDESVDEKLIQETLNEENEQNSPPSLFRARTKNSPPLKSKYNKKPNDDTTTTTEGPESSYLGDSPTN